MNTWTDRTQHYIYRKYIQVVLKSSRLVHIYEDIKPEL